MSERRTPAYLLGLIWGTADSMERVDKLDRETAAKWGIELQELAGELAEFLKFVPSEVVEAYLAKDIAVEGTHGQS